MQEIKRDRYLNRLIESIDNGLIKVITGLRRSGKSYLLNVLFYNYLLKEKNVDPKHIIRFAFDNDRDLKKLGEDLVSLRMKKAKVDPHKFSDYLDGLIKGRGHYYVLLDEVQEMDGFEFVLNGLLSRPNVDVFVTGSNAKFLAKDIITEFRGRGDKIHILPLSFSECSKYYDKDDDKALKKYMHFGGLPFVVLSKSDEKRVEYLKSQIEETYLTDITSRYDVRNTVELDELLNVLASGISGLVNPKKIACTFRSVRNSPLTEDTIGKYIKHFEDSFLVEIANRYDVKGKKYISTPYKIYFEDLGIRNARIGFRQTEYNHIMENLIYNELRFRGYSVDVGQVEIRESIKEPNGVRKQQKHFLEVDFVANKGSKRYYIQSVYRIEDEDKLNQEIKSLKNIDDSFKKIVVSYEYTVPRYDQNGIFYIGLMNFLSDENSLDK